MQPAWKWALYVEVVSSFLQCLWTDMKFPVLRGRLRHELLESGNCITAGGNEDIRHGLRDTNIATVISSNKVSSGWAVRCALNMYSQ